MNSKGNTYVLLDIFSIPQIHVGCKLLAVNSLYVYAIAAVVSLLSHQVLLFLAVQAS